ncbi:MAG: hypothetical protein Fur0011_1740 [Candidatus Microgenomates bacterium]
MSNPENGDGKFEQSPNDLGEQWVVRWVELFKKFLGVNELRKATKELAAKKPDFDKIKANIFEGVGGSESKETKAILDELTDALVDRDEAALDEVLKKAKPLANNIVDDERGKIENELRSVLDVRKKGNQEEFEKLEKSSYEKTAGYVDKLRDLEVADLDKKLKNPKLNKEAVELKKLISAMRELRKQEELVDKRDINEIIREAIDADQKNLLKTKRGGGLSESEIKMEEKIQKATHEVIKRVEQDGVSAIPLTREEFNLLKRWLVTESDPTQKRLKEKIVAEVIGRMDENSEGYKEMLKWFGDENNQKQNEQPRIGKNGRFDVRSDVNGGVDEVLNAILESQEGERLGRSGMLNIDPRIYDDLNIKLREKIKFNGDVLVKDEEFSHLRRISPKLTPEQKTKVEHILFDLLIQDIRMAMDEGLSLQERHYEPLLTRYNTLRSIRGLDTGLKQAAIDKLNFEILAFMAFNGYQTVENLKRYAEVFTKLGPESNMGKTFRLNETWKIKNKEGKEVEVGEFNIFDVARVFQSKIVDPLDRAHFDLASDAERVYASMVYRSNNPDQKTLDRTTVLRQMYLEKYGEDGYHQILKRYYGGKKKIKLWSTEEMDFLKKVNKPYFDYFNGAFVYLYMTGQIGDYVLNASPTNSKLVPPAGVAEILWKYDMRGLGLFHETYKGVLVPEIILTVKSAFTSVFVKEAGELFGYLLNIDEDSVAQTPSIFTGLLGGKRQDKDPRLGFAKKMQQAFMKSMFKSEEIVLSEHNKKLKKYTTIFDDYPIKKDSEGNLKLDAMGRRRDWKTFANEMCAQIDQWTDRELEMLEFGFILEKFKYDPNLVKTLSDPSISKRDKLKWFVSHMNDGYADWEALKAKRGDNPIKYNLDAYQKAMDAAMKMCGSLSYQDLFAFIEEHGKILGENKIGPLFKMFAKRIREYRTPMKLFEAYVVPEVKNGIMEIDAGSYVDSDLPGSIPLPKLIMKSVSMTDWRENHGKVSKGTLKHVPDAIDEEEIDFKYVLERAAQKQLLTEEEYQEERKHFYEELKSIETNKGVVKFLVDLWEHASGKRLVARIAAYYNMSPDLFMSMVLGGGGELVKLLWKYFNH